MSIEFQAWPKTPRLFRDAIITEKIDGTNAAVQIAYAEPTDQEDRPDSVYGVDGDLYCVVAQSRKRLIYPGDDNFAFAKWVHENATDLVRVLGLGCHFGEWWGSGIQRGYGLTNGDKRFSLFNVHRYRHVPFHDVQVSGLGLVPVLDAYTFDTARVLAVKSALAETGSQAAPGFMRPEGVVVFHSASGQVFKSLLDNDDQPKGAVG